MSDRHTSKIFLTRFESSPYDGSGRQSVTSDRHTQPLLQMGAVFPNAVLPIAPEVPHVSLNDCRLPTDRERQAFQLRRTMGLRDRQIAHMLRTSRETVNRRISRYQSKVKALSLLCPSASCELLARLAT